MDGHLPRHRRLDDRPIEFPCVDDRRTGRRHRYGYAVTNAANVGQQSMHLVKYDLATGAATVHDFGAGRTPAESVFVPAGVRAGEDEGYVLLYVHDAARNASDLIILDAARFGRRYRMTYEEQVAEWPPADQPWLARIACKYEVLNAKG